MTRSYLLILIIFLPLAGFSQSVSKNNPLYDYEQTLHFGFTIGTHVPDFRLEFSDEFLNNDTLLRLDVDRQAGFNLGAVINYHVTENFDVRLIPTLTLASRSLVGTYASGREVPKEISSTFVEAPLLLKYKAKRMGNFRFFVLAGAKYNYDFGSEQDVDQGPEEIPQLVQSYFLYEYGLGLDIYFPYFKFTPQVKFARSPTNVLVDNDDPISRSLDGLYPRVTYISFFFE